MSVTTKVIHLDPADNVVVCTKSLDAEERIFILDELVQIKTPVGIGHKLACKAIQKGDIIIKYGVEIGTASEDIPFGDHVHTHNMKSNYIETYLIK